MQIIAGKYEVIRELGHGGYGKVLLVRHRDLGVTYALKLLTRVISEDKELIERFKREAEILSRFSHPGSSQLRDFGKTDDGLYYMTLDFCEGTVLQQVLEKEQWLPVITVLQIMAEILDVLSAAHAIGIIHRDIKPSNIMLQNLPPAPPTVRILDFGIAKILESSSKTSVTREGMTIGTPQYMSPEQAAGESDLDPRVDIYATGVMMYELITGGVPFQGETVIQTLLRHLTQPPAPFAKRLGLPEKLEQIVFKALEKERDKRFQNAAEFKAACDALIAELSGKDLRAGEKQRVEKAHDQNATVAIQSVKDETKILCLDDNEMILNIMRHLLEQKGFKVFTASNFSVIHDYIFTQGARLMLCDVEMPGLPGTKICKMLKRTAKDLKIILFSNVPERELEKLSIESGADAWLSKNARPDEWIAKIRTFL